jgi:hypothetical protein
MDLWDFFQQSQINDAHHRINRAENARVDAENANRELLRQIDKLQLANMAIWSLVQDKLGLTDAQLSDRIREIDLKDGRLDGRVSSRGRECPTCRRIMSVRHSKCLYCGDIDFEPRPFS